MQLPSETVKNDIEAICAYLISKPAGATAPEAAAALGRQDPNGRKRNTCRQMGFIEQTSDGRMRITARGREALRGDGQHNPQPYLEAISTFPAYRAVIARAVSEGRFTIAPSETSAFWNEQFPSVVSKKERSRHRQVLCFFHLMEAAALGESTRARPGRKTEFVIDADESRRLVGEGKQRTAADQSGRFREPEEDAAPKETDSVGRKAEAPEGSVQTEATPVPPDGEDGEAHRGRTETSAAGGKSGGESDDTRWRHVLAALDRYRSDNAELRGDFERLRADVTDGNADLRAEKNRTQSMDLVESIRALRREMADLRVKMAYGFAALAVVVVAVLTAVNWLR